MSMDARSRLSHGCLLIAVVACLAAAPARPQHRYQTANFIAVAPTAEIARQVAETAEVYRRELARDWLGTTLKKWKYPCPISVDVGQIGAGGQTTFKFGLNTETGVTEVYDWDMKVQGTLERILDSVIPHEVSHTIFACHFRRPMPRWADEGAATLAEHESERRRQLMILKDVINTSRMLPLNKLINEMQYPKEMEDVYTLYAEGYSLADYLVQQKGRAKFLHFLSSAHKLGWDAALRQVYEINSVAEFEKQWRGWVIAGSPDLDETGRAIVKTTPNKRPGTAETVRGQSPSDPFLGEPKFFESTQARALVAAPVTPTEVDTSSPKRLPEDLPTLAQTEGQRPRRQESPKASTKLIPAVVSSSYTTGASFDADEEKHEQMSADEQPAVQPQEYRPSPSDRPRPEPRQAGDVARGRSTQSDLPYDRPYLRSR